MSMVFFAIRFQSIKDFANFYEILSRSFVFRMDTAIELTFHD